MKKLFFKNVMPAMLAFAFSGVYAIVDGWFIGRNVGDMGLAGINIAYPLTAFLQAVGTGIGMGGAIRMAICAGRGEEQKKRQYFGNTITLLLIGCVAVTIFLLFSANGFLRIFGASGEIFSLAEAYIRLIVWGAVFQILGTGLVPILRNENQAFLAMMAMIAGFLTNVLLDYLFVAVFGYGMAGAAAATVIGQAVTMLICIWKLAGIYKKTELRLFLPRWEWMKKILKVGLSPFGLTLSPNIVIIIMNKGALNYGGDHAVAAYAVVSYVVCIVQLLLQGVGDGCQPLISRFYGAGNRVDMQKIRKIAFLFAGVVSIFYMAVLCVLRDWIPRFFGVSAEISATVASILPIFTLGFICMAVLRVTISYFYAVKKNIFAYFLIYGEPALLAILVALIFPRIWGISGVWFSVPITQCLLAVLGLTMLCQYDRQNQKGA